MSPDTGLTAVDPAAQTSQADAGPVEAPERVVGLKHPWRWVGVAVEALLLAMLVHSLMTEKGFEWGVVGNYLFARPILDGVLTTIYLTAATMTVGVALGLVLAVMRLSKNPIFSTFAGLYISVFRAVPALVQMVFWFNLAALIPILSLGVPFGPSFVTFSATSIFSPFLAATLGLGLSESAYMAEIFRGGITTVPLGQSDAARAMGLRRSAALRHIVLPQAMRSVIPPLGNEVIGMLKYTSLASVISVTELLESATLIYDRTFETVPLLIVVALWYLALTTVLTAIQRRVERRFGRGVNREESRFFSQVISNAFQLRTRKSVRRGGST
jgi:polar amino acid transport system permease protein